MAVSEENLKATRKICGSPRGMHPEHLCAIPGSLSADTGRKAEAQVETRQSLNRSAGYLSIPDACTKLAGTGTPERTSNSIGPRVHYCDGLSLRLKPAEPAFVRCGDFVPLELEFCSTSDVNIIVFRSTGLSMRDCFPGVKVICGTATQAVQRTYDASVPITAQKEPACD